MKRSQRDTPLTTRDAHELRNGQLVSHPMSFTHGDGKYIGAVTHVRALARPGLVLDRIYDIGSLPNWLPFNHRAEIVAGSGDDLVVEILQGVEPFLATFSVRVTRRDPVIRWELDPDRPHDIEDMWGFFTARPFGPGRSLLTTGIAFDLGSGVLRMLEKEILSVIPDATMDARLHAEGGHGSPASCPPTESGLRKPSARVIRLGR
jgi:hypothetical protein